MKQFKARSLILLISVVLLQFSCNDTASNTEENDSDTTTSTASNIDTISGPTYDPKMDSYLTGGKLINKLGDSLGIKMYEVIVKPGDTAELHSHPDHIFYVVQGGQLAVTFQGRGRQVMDLKPGMGAISGPVSDAGKNVGKTTVKLLVVDIYRPRSTGSPGQ
jgi:quercetin dioxygenase-like cupin family protein